MSADEFRLVQVHAAGLYFAGWCSLQHQSIEAATLCQQCAEYLDGVVTWIEWRPATAALLPARRAA